MVKPGTARPVVIPMHPVSDRRSRVDRRAPDLWNPYAEQMSENRRQNRGRRSTEARW
jgi:hypothetical protein